MGEQRESEVLSELDGPWDVALREVAVWARRECGGDQGSREVEVG